MDNLILTKEKLIEILQQENNFFTAEPFYHMCFKLFIDVLYG